GRERWRRGARRAPCGRRSRGPVDRGGLEPTAGRARRRRVRDRVSPRHARGEVPRDHPPDAGGGPGMSTITFERLPVERPAQGSPPHGHAVAVSMVNSEFLKVRRHRGLVIWSVLLTVGVVTLVYSVL